MTEETKKPDVNVAPEKQGRQGKRAQVFADLLFNIILVSCFCFLGYLVYEQDKAINVLFEQQNSFGSQRNDANERIDELLRSVETLEMSLVQAREDAAALMQAQSAELDRLENELVSTRLRINSNNSGASQEWLLAEASSLLRLSQQHLVVAKNIRTAQALFIAADDVLEQIDDPSIFSIREILAAELATLRAVEEVDVRDIYLRLGAAAEQAAMLEVSNDLQSEIQSGEALSLSSESTEESGWFSRLTSSLGNTLDNYLVVRRRDAPLQALMTPGQEAALMQTIQLQIEQARTALISGEQEIYSDSLDQARNNIETYLSGDPAIKSVLLETIDRYRQQRITTVPPSLNRTRAALQQILSVNSQNSDG